MSVVDARSLVNPEEGWVHRRVFWDPDLYALELERIFARCWLFVAHESQVEQPGDFITAWMGQDEVIVARGRDGVVNAFLNSCPHRGNRVCHAEAGNARGFVCNYHGWAFALDGSLRGTHENEAWEATPGFDPAEHGLKPVAQIDSYKGLVFATFDPEAPPLAEYLGDFCWYLDAVFDNDEGGTEFVGGAIRSIIRANWKFGAENFTGDGLHAGWTHDSGARAMFGFSMPSLGDQEDAYHVNVNGHCWSFRLDTIGGAKTLASPEMIDYLRGREAEVAERLGPVRARMIGATSTVNVFPNLSFLPGTSTIRTWQPKGPFETELHTWVFVNRNMPEHLKEVQRRGAMMTFSPTGVFETDDGENWEYATRVNEGFVTRDQRLYTALGLGTEIHDSGLPGNVFRGILNEANQRAFHARWAELMDAKSWAEVGSS